MKARILLALAAALTSFGVASTASAQQRVDTVSYTGPDRGMLRSGALTLSLSYVPALVVGVASPLPEDRYLLAPVAGPWIDFAKRDCPGCAHETLNRVLLVTDGVIQGLGALEMLGSFFFVEHSVVTSPASLDNQKTAFRIVPNRMAGGYGVTALGKF